MLKVVVSLVVVGLISTAEAATKKALFEKEKDVWTYGTYNPEKSHKRDKDSYAVNIKNYISSMNLSSDIVAVKKTAVVSEVESLVTTMQLKAGQIVLSKDQKPLLIEAVFANGKVVAKPLEINPSSRFRLKDINEYFTPLQRTNMVILDKTEIVAVLEEKCSKDGLYCRGQKVSEINGIAICEKLVTCPIRKDTTINGVFSNGTLLIHTSLFPTETFLNTQQPEPKQGEVSP